MSSNTSEKAQRLWPFKYSVKPGGGLVCNVPEASEAVVPPARPARSHADAASEDDAPRKRASSPTRITRRRDPLDVCVDLDWRAPGASGKAPVDG